MMVGAGSRGARVSSSCSCHRPGVSVHHYCPCLAPASPSSSRRPPLPPHAAKGASPRRSLRGIASAARPPPPPSPSLRSSSMPCQSDNQIIDPCLRNNYVYIPLLVESMYVYVRKMMRRIKVVWFLLEGTTS